MSFTFQYSVLKYVHSQNLGEEVNIGIIFYFPSLNHVEFLYPQSLSRINSIYNKFPKSQIIKYLKSFQYQAEYLNKNNIYDKNDLFDFNKFIERFFLRTDATALIFSEAKMAVSFKDDIKNIIEEYFKLYFPNNTNKSIKHVKHDEYFILKKYKNCLSSSNLIDLKLLNEKYKISKNNIVFKSDFAWQNHSLNLVKAIGFDLNKTSDIIDKALLYNAKINYLTDVAVKENCRFDLIVSKPSNENFYSCYSDALGILRNSDAPFEIIEENEIEKYSLKTINEIEK